MKKYNLEINCSLEAGYIYSKIYSKGHHDKDDFMEKAQEYYDLELKKTYTCQDTFEKKKIYQIWGKMVGYFENGQRICSQLKVVNRPMKGYFPVTVVQL